MRYADDFVVLAKSKSQIETAQALVDSLLESIGLELHPDKTRITNFQQGFHFLGRVQLSTSAIEVCLEQQIPVIFMSQTGNYKGHLWSSEFCDLPTSEEVSHPAVQQPVSYRRAIQLQIQQYKRCLQDSTPYQPFTRST